MVYTGERWRRMKVDSGTFLFLCPTILIPMLESEEHGCMLSRLGLSRHPVFSYIGFSLTFYFLGSGSLLPRFPKSKVAADLVSVFHKITASVKTILTFLGLLISALLNSAPISKLFSLICYVLMLLSNL